MLFKAIISTVEDNQERDNVFVVKTAAENLHAPQEALTLVTEHIKKLHPTLFPVFKSLEVLAVSNRAFLTTDR